jgi:hypothetical protein
VGWVEGDQRVSNRFVATLVVFIESSPILVSLLVKPPNLCDPLGRMVFLS